MLLLFLTLLLQLSAVQAQLCAFDFSSSLEQSSGDLECVATAIQLGSSGNRQPVSGLFKSIATPQFSSALSLWQTFQRIDHVNSLQFVVNLNTTLTHAFWLFIPSLQHSRKPQYIQSAVDLTDPEQSNFQYGFARTDANNRYSHFCAGVDLIGSAIGIEGMQGCTDQPVPTRQWVHLAIVVEALQVSVFVNAIKSLQFTANAYVQNRVQNNQPTFQLGSLGGDESNAFTGLLRQFVFAQYALSAEQIATLAAGSTNQAVGSANTIQPQLVVDRPESHCSYVQPYQKEVISSGIGFRTPGCGFEAPLVLNASYTKMAWVHWDYLVDTADPMTSGPISLASNAFSNTLQVSWIDFCGFDSKRQAGLVLFELSKRRFQLSKRCFELTNSCF